MINHYLSMLTNELRAEGIADPLAHPFTLAAIWDDLATLSGEALPASVRGYLAEGQPVRDAPQPEDGGSTIGVAAADAGGTASACGQ